MKPLRHILLLLALLPKLFPVETTAPIASPDLIFAEQGGLVAFEAEHFVKQELTTVRAWHLTTASLRAGLAPDTDGTHVLGASGGAYLEILPDTRWTHREKLSKGENISHVPGEMAVLTYRVHFANPGRYQVWARVFATGGEDNGVHFGLDGTWPENGQRWQTVKKHAWHWDSRQRTAEVHAGVPGQLYLDVPTAGEHTIQVSMREDGFELDRILLTNDPAYTPAGLGPATRVHAGHLPEPFAVPAGYTEAPAVTPLPPKPPAPPKPAAQTPPPPHDATVMAVDLPLEGTGFYRDRDKWAAIHPDRNKEASVKFTSPALNGRYRLTLHVVGENDGNSRYEVLLGGHSLGVFTAPPSQEMFAEGPAFTKTWNNLNTNQGELVEVRAWIASNDGKEWSRARWSKLVFEAQERDPGTELARLDLAAAQRAALFRPVPRQPDGDAQAQVTGELRTWHKVTLDLAGPFAAETDTSPNPFTDHRFDVTFTHASGAPACTVPGYFAADGRAAESGANAGTVWRAHLSPDKPGVWHYRVSFHHGPQAAIKGDGVPLAPYDGLTGTFAVMPTDKTGRDFRAKGRLTYTGGHYLRHAGSGEWFLKAGADAPETLLAYADFDDTIALKPNVPLKSWAPHTGDWREGDPSWRNGRGKGLIGALNYLAAKGVNAVSFLTYNAAGDGDNVWPFVARNEKFHYDCSKLDQWGLVFDHAQRLGLFLHFKLQENENDDDRLRGLQRPGLVPESLDGGAMGAERSLYFRELIARYGHLLALNWNLGEENTQSSDEQRAMVKYFHDHDPYRHLVVIHSFPNQQDKVYEALLGGQSLLTGASMQNSWDAAHRLTLKWVRASAAAGRPWVVCNDEQNPANHGVPPDLGYQGYAGQDRDGRAVGHDEHDIRKFTLWGTLLAGGAGVEYYFGYHLPENDLVAEDFRSRDRSWDYCRIALGFFRDHAIPLAAMHNADELVCNPAHDNSRYCLAQPGELYLVYLPTGGTGKLDLTGLPGTFRIAWFNPREGGPLQRGTVPDVAGGAPVSLGLPPSAPEADWLVVVRR